MHDTGTHPEHAAVTFAADQLRAAFGDAPHTAIVLGSGLGVLVDHTDVRAREAYGALGLPQSGIIGHAGVACVGTLGTSDVILMSGRVHLYEGWSPSEVVRGVRALRQWGVQRLLLTAAVGACHATNVPGDLVLVTDHVSFQGCSPLVGPAWGTRFPDLSNAYDRAVCTQLEAAAARTGVALRRGVYAAMLGPAYETPAEIRMLRAVGCDVVGMSTVPEILAAAECGMTAGAVAVVTNFAAGVVAAPVDHSTVTKVAGEAGRSLARVIESWLGAGPTV